MKHSIELDMTDGPIKVGDLRGALSKVPTEADVMVSRKAEHLSIREDFGNMRPPIVLRVEWDDQPHTRICTDAINHGNGCDCRDEARA